MLSLLAATGRWCAIFALGVLLIFAIPLSWLTRQLSGGTLNVADWCVNTILRLQLRRAR